MKAGTATGSGPEPVAGRNASGKDAWLDIAAGERGLSQRLVHRGHPGAVVRVVDERSDVGALERDSAAKDLVLGNEQVAGAGRLQAEGRVVVEHVAQGDAGVLYASARNVEATGIVGDDRVHDDGAGTGGSHQ